MFDVLYIKETDNNRQVEDKFKQELLCKNIYRKAILNGHNQTELFTINHNYDYDEVSKLLDTLVNEFKLPLIKYTEDKISHYENEISNLKKIQEETIKKYEKEVDFCKEVVAKYDEIISNNAETIKNDRVIISQLFGILNKV